jgi:hypothetical protein
LEKVIELAAEPVFTVSADVVHQLVHEDETGLIFGKEAADGVAAGGFLRFLMLGNFFQGLLAADLPGDLGPGRLADGCAVVATAPFDGVELLADKDG